MNTAIVLIMCCLFAACAVQSPSNEPMGIATQSSTGCVSDPLTGSGANIVPRCQVTQQQVQDATIAYARGEGYSVNFNNGIWDLSCIFNDNDELWQCHLETLNVQITCSFDQTGAPYCITIVTP